MFNAMLGNIATKSLAAHDAWSREAYIREKPFRHAHQIICYLFTFESVPIRIGIVLFSLANIGCQPLSPKNEIQSNAKPDPVVTTTLEDLERNSGRVVIVEGQPVVAGRFVELWTDSMGAIDLIGIDDASPYESDDARIVRVNGLLTWRWELRKKPTSIEDAVATRRAQKEDVYIRKYQISVSEVEIIQAP